MSAHQLLDSVAFLVGFITILYYLTILIKGLYKGFRLYVWCQYCNQTDYRQKYGQWAVISGATDGIGLAMAKEFARRGHSILAIGRNEEKLATTKKMLEEIANVGEVETVKIDLSDCSLDNYERIRGQIDAENRDIGILVNNAGIFPTRLGRFNKFELDFIMTMINVNVAATVCLTRLVMPGMLSRKKGLIVNISSPAGQLRAPFFCVYGTTKLFMDSFSSTLNMEYTENPVQIVNLQPALVKTTAANNFINNSISNYIAIDAETFARTSINAISSGYQTFVGSPLQDLIRLSLLTLLSIPIKSLRPKPLKYICEGSSAVSELSTRKSI